MDILRWSWMIASCLQNRAFCFAESFARMKACTSAAPESMASHRPWPASPSKSSRVKLWMSLWHATMLASPTHSRTGLQEATGPGCLVVLTAGPAPQPKLASHVHGSRIWCSWSGRRTCSTWRNTARGCGATTSWGGNTRACWKNTARLRRAPGRLAARVLENATGRRGISVLGRRKRMRVEKKMKRKGQGLHYSTRITEQQKGSKSASPSS